MQIFSYFGLWCKSSYEYPDYCKGKVHGWKGNLRADHKQDIFLSLHFQGAPLFSSVLYIEVPCDTSQQKSFHQLKKNGGNFLVAQWLELYAFIAKVMDLIPGQGTEILETMWHGQKSFLKNTKHSVQLHLTHIY